jgi:hypothetical protein
MNNTEKDRFLLKLQSNLGKFKRQCNSYFGIVCDDYEGVSTTLTYTDECSYVRGEWVREDLVVKLRGWVLIERAAEGSKGLKVVLDVSPCNVDYVGDELVVDMIRAYLEEKGDD